MKRMIGVERIPPDEFGVNPRVSGLEVPPNFMDLYPKKTTEKRQKREEKKPLPSSAERELCKKFEQKVTDRLESK